MGFVLFIAISFIVGILAGIPIAKYVTPQSPTTIIILMSPWLILYFFSENPTVNDIQYMYFSWVIGILCYLTYNETKKQL